MPSLARFQRALNLYGAAYYWALQTAEAPKATPVTMSWEQLVEHLARRATDLGVSQEQLDDAQNYARRCYLENTSKPSHSDSSAAEFLARLGCDDLYSA